MRRSPRGARSRGGTPLGAAITFLICHAAAVTAKIGFGIDLREGRSMLSWRQDGAPFRMSRRFPRADRAFALFAAVALWSSSFAGELDGSAQFQKDIKPILSQFCFGCHDSASKKGGVV